MLGFRIQDFRRKVIGSFRVSHKPEIPCPTHYTVSGAQGSGLGFNLWLRAEGRGEGARFRGVQGLESRIRGPELRVKDLRVGLLMLVQV